MHFELLANELLLDLFEYLNAIDLFHAFYNLNYRFNELLSTHFHTYAVDIQSASNNKFNIFCSKYLPLIIKKIISLNLNYDYKIGVLNNDFFHDHFTINKFSHLKYLQIHTPELINFLKILSDCRQLSYLTHLKITKCSFSSNNNLYELVKIISTLPKLTHCCLDIDVSQTNSILFSSETIKYLYMKNIRFSLSDLSQLFEHTPNLQHICATLLNEDISSQSLIVAPSITRLNLTIKNPLSMLDKLFKIVPNLSHLTLEINETFDKNYLDGHQWEQIITKHLLYIKQFRFFVKYIFNREISLGEIDKILETFRTPFWINEHHWFVQCQWNQKIDHPTLSLYTLPTRWKDIYAIDSNTQSKSTYSQYEYNRLLNNIYQIVSINEGSYMFFQCDYLHKINHLKVILSGGGYTWTFISTIDNLTPLKISLDRKSDLSQIESLIDQFPHCYSLTIDNALPLKISKLNIKRTHIYQISLTNYCYNATECSLLYDSLLGSQCQILSICFTDRRHILTIINEMSNLRILTCFCVDDKWNLDDSVSEEDRDVFKWLENNLPSKCVVNKCKIDHFNIRIWIN